MTLSSLIQSVSAEVPTVATLEQFAASSEVTLFSLLDAFARELAEGYLHGKYSWEFGDSTMNNLYSCAYGNSDMCLPEFARQVFAAFDEGEYVHAGESPDLDGEPRTKKILVSLIG